MPGNGARGQQVSATPAQSTRTLAVLALILGLCSLPSLLLWVVFSLLGLSALLMHLLQPGNTRADYLLALSIPVGWLAWAALAWLLWRFTSLGTRPWPRWVVAGLLGGVAIDLFVVLGIVWRDPDLYIAGIAWFLAPTALLMVCIRRYQAGRAAVAPRLDP